MNNKDMLNAIGEVDDALIEEAAPAEKCGKKVFPGKGRSRWGIAACTVVMTAGIILAMFHIAGSGNLLWEEPPVVQMPSVDSEGRQLWVDTRKRNNASVMTQDIAIIWPWELETIYEQYGSMTFEGRQYDGGNMLPISESLLGEKLGVCDAVGYDHYNEDSEYHRECEVREIKGILPELAMAVKLDDNYYTFEKEEYDPPETLGEFMEGFSLPETLPLTVFTHYAESDDSKGRYIVSEACSKEIWNMLGAHRDAAFYEWEHQDYEALYKGEYLSFTAKSEPLGISNSAFYVTSSGHIWTNACDWAYSFEIGKEAAEEIINHALANAETAPQLQTKFYLTGTIVEMGEDYFMLDDTVLMKNPKDGKVFTIYTDDIRVRRYITRDIVRVGSTVTVEYDGIIYAEEPDVVRGAIGMRPVIIDGGNVMVLE